MKIHIKKGKCLNSVEIKGLLIINNAYGFNRRRYHLVELRGIEPLSENNLTGLSSGGVCYLHSLTVA